MATEIAPSAEKIASGDDLKIDFGFGWVAKSWVVKMCPDHGNTLAVRDPIGFRACGRSGQTRGNMR